jgi:DNA-binding MarR family transcriptional regulator
MTKNKKLPFAKKEAEDSTGFLIWQVTTLWQREVGRALRPLELTQVQFVLLASLLWLSKTEKSITQIRLARHAKLDVMMCSQVLRVLEKRKWIRRLSHPSDTRAKQLELTSEGERLCFSAVPLVEKVDELFFAGDALKQKELNQTLQVILQQRKNKE